jgi:hypothetical protein
MRSATPRSRTRLALGLLLIALLTPAATAHDVPSDVTLQAMVRPEGQRLRVLVRAPLVAMQDMLFPTTGPGYLDLQAARSSGILEDAADLWIGESLDVFENDRPLPTPDLVAVRVSLPSNRSFATWDDALAHTTGEGLAESTQIIWQQAMLDMLFESPIQAADGDFSIRPRHGRLGMRVVTVLRFLPPGGGVRAFEYRGEPGLLRLDPRWHHAAARFVGSGFFHILDGLDHLLFLGCLIIPLRRLRELVPVVTAFTVAHSITLIAAAYGLAPDALWFPPLVEALIALSIVYMAVENMLRLEIRRRWRIAFAFGLVHGFGFAFVLRDTLQFAGAHLLTSLLSFNLGVELGQLFVLVLMVPALDWIYRKIDPSAACLLLSALIAHTGWHWMTQRASDLFQYDITPTWLAALPWQRLPWAAPLVIVGVLVWRWRRREDVSELAEEAVSPAP